MATISILVCDVCGRQETAKRRKFVYTDNNYGALCLSCWKRKRHELYCKVVLVPADKFNRPDRIRVQLMGCTVHEGERILDKDRKLSHLGLSVEEESSVICWNDVHLNLERADILGIKYESP